MNLTLAALFVGASLAAPLAAQQPVQDTTTVTRIVATPATLTVEMGKVTPFHAVVSLRIRLQALGATRGRIRRMVFRQGLALIAGGLPAGIVLALFTSRFASAFLVNVQGSDPMVLAGVAALLTVTSLTAMLGPAHRAAGVEPLAALRAD